MRRVLLALLLSLTAASAAQAQALQSPRLSAPDQTAPAPRDARGVAPAVELAPAPRIAVEKREGVADAAAARELSARGLFAIIGVVVVAVALIALAS